MHQQSDTIADDHAAMAARPEWRVMAKAAELAHQGQFMMAEATRWAAGYHGLRNADGSMSL